VSLPAPGSDDDGLRRGDQEIYALLATYQALRIAITDATISRPDVDPDRGSFTIALNAARDQLIKAAGVIADTVIDLVGVIGRQVLNHLMPDRRCRTNRRVVKRAISNYAAKSARQAEQYGLDKHAAIHQALRNSQEGVHNFGKADPPEAA